MTQSVLFIDDEPYLLRAYERNLRGTEGNWRASFAECPIDAWNRICNSSYDTIVCDVRMPGMTGLELLQRIKSSDRTRSIPVIIVTGDTERTLKRRALDLGAVDLLNKPVDRDDLIARIRSALRIKVYEDQIRGHNAELDRKVQQRTAQLAASRLEIIWRLGKAAEFRDSETGNHVVRVGWYSRIIAESLKLSDEFVETIFLAAPLHDIGKIGVPDAILLKQGRLTDSEWRMMRQHCEIGVSILQDDCKWHSLAGRKFLGLSDAEGAVVENPVVEVASRIARSHHEKWDGTGYPDGLTSTAIPLEARIVAVADVFDALRSSRPYKPAFSLDNTMSILEKGRGAHCDPDVYDAFAAALDRILQIDDSLSDTPSFAASTAPDDEFVSARR